MGCRQGGKYWSMVITASGRIRVIDIGKVYICDAVNCNMLYRKIESYIENYLQSDSNKVLIVDGARQIGKF